MERRSHFRVGSVLALVVAGSACVGQTYLQPSVGVQSTYTGACLVSTCSGTSYDSGGAAGNYAANVNAIFRTFCPNTAGMCLQATFTSFSMNDTYFLCFGPNSCCDYLGILNGPAQNSPALYNNCTTSPGTITASNPSGCLTFRFTSDGTVELPGWACTLSCVPCAGGPSGTTNADCAYATPVCVDTPFADASNGPGISAEGCSGCTTSEYYTNWYRIQVQTSGTLAFTINPNNNADDFDPVVYGPNVGCGALGAPVRCSYAIGAGNGNTGLGNGAADVSEDVFGDQWVSQMNVTAGQVYYVLINGWSATSGSNGFLLDWTGTASLNCSFLPVELLYFNAACESGTPLLEWATGAEVNSSHFVVERSADGDLWKAIGTVNAAHHSTTETAYLFTDPLPLKEVSAYYRLRQVDLEGHETLGEPMLLQRCGNEQAALQAVPNPFTEILHVRFNGRCADGSSTLELLDLTGRRMMQRSLRIEEGTGTIDLDLKDLLTGTYTVVLRASNGEVAGRTRVVKN